MPSHSTTTSSSALTSFVRALPLAALLLIQGCATSTDNKIVVSDHVGTTKSPHQTRPVSITCTGCEY